MKSIVLTEEHKSKLLEMCNKLFPEYDFTLDKFRECSVTFGLKSKKLYEKHIHWFEFVMTHLFYKIYDLWRHEEINCVTIFHLNIHNYYLNTDDKNEKYHPINYLYEQFKLLK